MVRVVISTVQFGSQEWLMYRGFIAEELPVDIPAGVERKNVDIASGKAFRAFFFGNLLPPCTE
jgi:hypothetical protein